MKKLFYSLALIIATTSCTSRPGKMEKEAKVCVQDFFGDFAKGPSSVKLSNVEAVYKSDSLCILHLQLTENNESGRENTKDYEYVYIASGNSKYEACQEKSRESSVIFQEEDAYEKTKKDKFYEELSYNDGMYYKAAILANSIGRVVGDKTGEEEVNIYISTGTGSWNIGQDLDDFGEETGKKYLFITGKGTCGNSLTKNSYATIRIVYDEKGAHLILFGDGTNVVKGEGNIPVKIKDSDGKVRSFIFYNTNGGRMDNIYDSSSSFETILKKGGKIAVSASTTGFSNNDYLFKLDISGFDKAAKLCGIKVPSQEEHFRKECEEFTQKKCPQRKDVCQVLDSITYEAKDNAIHNWYTLSGVLDDEDVFSEKLKGLLRDELVVNLKKSTQLDNYKDAEVTFVYHYRSVSSGKELYKVSIDKESY